MKFLHEEVKIVHTDLKPENILFQRSSEFKEIISMQDLPLNLIKKHQENMEEESYIEKSIIYKEPLDLNIKIIDFGGATYLNDTHNGTINTRQYRSPEVLLGCCNWNDKSDVWSLACIFVELYTGELLFPTHEDKEHLAIIEKNSKEKAFPLWMVNNCKYKSFKFIESKDKTFKFDTNSLSSKGYTNYLDHEVIDKLINITESDDNIEFSEFIKSMLVIDPNYRPSCSELLNHIFLNK